MKNKQMSRLKIIRRAFGVSQAALAHTIKADQSLISKIETGDAPLTARIKKKIAMALNVDEEELFPKEE